MYERTIICLANSRKPPTGRCVAGKVIEGEGEWVRPVSARATKEVSEEERRYESGIRAQLLDIISVMMLHPEPAGHQSENHVLDPDYYWEKKGVATWEDVKSFEDPFDPNFWVAADSTYHGFNDKVLPATVAGINSSLKLILVPDLKVSVKDETQYQRPKRRRVSGQFNYHGVYYSLYVTDPDIEEQYLKQGLGEYPVKNAALCISLTEIRNGSASRLIASVITEDMFL